MNRHVLTPIDAALDLVAAERSAVAAERDAFAAFARRVDARPTRSPAGAGVRSAAVGIGAGTGDGSGGDPDPTERLRRAYRETVMAVDHYDDAYDEPLRVNVAAEFGADIATALCEGTPFTPAFQAALSDAAASARANRERFADVLDRERRSLADARAELDAVVDAMDRRRSTEPADDASTPSLTDLERRCERVAEERQSVVGSQRISLSDHALHDYLYGDRSWTYPVLSVVATLVEDLSVMRRRSSEGTG